MKSLQKAFDILEYVILQNGTNVTPSEAADALKINLATCTRIMGELVRMGYLAKISRKSGYVAGPMTVSLCTRDQVYKRIADAAENPVRTLSEELGCQVNISVLHESQRVMLSYHLGNPYTEPWKVFRFTDHQDTATGRLLLAVQSVSGAEEICRLCGLPLSGEEYHNRIIRDGFLRFELDGLSIIGYLIRVPGYPVSAFGFGVPKVSADRAFELAAETARIITEKLTAPVCQAY